MERIERNIKKDRRMLLSITAKYYQKFVKCSNARLLIFVDFYFY